MGHELPFFWGSFHGWDNSEKEKMDDFPINKLDFNILSNKGEKLMNVDFIKSKYDIEKEKYDFYSLFIEKRKNEVTSGILNDLGPIKNIIKRNNGLKLEIYCNKGDLNQVF